MKLFTRSKPIKQVFMKNAVSVKEIMKKDKDYQKEARRNILLDVEDKKKFLEAELNRLQKTYLTVAKGW